MAGSPEKLTKNPKSLGLCLAFICLNISVALFVAIAILRKEACLDCKQFSPILLPMLIILATLLLFLGVSILMSLCLRRTRSLTRTPQVVISSIPAGDLEKSPTANLPYNHGEPFVECSSIDLPDYFTVVRNLGEVGLSVIAAVCTEDAPEIEPPPCYEQAVDMAATSDSPDNRLERLRRE